MSNLTLGVSSKEISEFKSCSAFLDIKKDDFTQNISDFTKYSQKSYEYRKSKCSPTIDLRGPKLGEVRNQGDIGWCYAHTTADLLSYKLGKRISAADIATNYNLKSGTTFFTEGGSVKKAFNATKNLGGACLEERFPSDDNGGSISHYKKILDSKKICSTSKSPPINELVEPFYQSLVPKNLIAVKDIKTDGNQDPILYTRRNDLCFPRIGLQNLSTVEKVSSPDPFFESDGINDQLSKDNPVAITYNSIYLSSGFDNNEEAPHSGTIVGRRFNESTEECDFLIRNTWGRSCNGYNSDLRRDNRCEDGNIWVPESDLGKILHGYTYLK